MEKIKQEKIKWLITPGFQYNKLEWLIIPLFNLQQELEDTTSKPLSDTNDEEEKPRNQSIAQIVYADNRVRINIDFIS